MNSSLRVAAAAVIALAAGWAGARLYLNRYAAPVERGVPVPAGEAGPASAVDSNSESTADFPPPRDIPDKLPDFHLADLDGRMTPVSTWRGKSLMINFWATWCPPCRREIPLLQTLHAQLSDRNIMVLGIAVDRVAAVKQFKERLKIAYPLLVGEQDALDLTAAFGVATPAFPFTVFTDNRGEVVTLYLGELHQTQADAILAVVDELNKDRIALPAARTQIAAQLDEIQRRGS